MMINSILQMSELFDFLGETDLTSLEDDLPEELLAPHPVIPTPSRGYGLLEELPELKRPVVVPEVASKFCPVFECGRVIFSRVSAMRRHWVLTHLATTLLFLCPVLGCQ
jgi:hypothetical protein